ncbi:MAG: hypothetical protein R2824_15860 [Saprospiraceae bacterium]
MSLFCGKKCECKRRCKSWFGLQPDLERACKNACKGNTGLTKEQFQCSGKYVDEAALILAYGYDPCSGGVSAVDVLDPTGSAEYEAEKMDSLQGTFLILGLLILAGLGVLYFMRK